MVFRRPASASMVHPQANCIPFGRALVDTLQNSAWQLLPPVTRMDFSSCFSVGTPVVSRDHQRHFAGGHKALPHVCVVSLYSLWSPSLLPPKAVSARAHTCTRVSFLSPGSSFLSQATYCTQDTPFLHVRVLISEAPLYVQLLRQSHPRVTA